MWINYQFMAVCPLILIFLHISSQKWLVFANYFGLPNFLPQLANFFTRIHPSYPWHFATLMMTKSKGKCWDFCWHSVVTIIITVSSESSRSRSLSPNNPDSPLRCLCSTQLCNDARLLFPCYLVMILICFVGCTMWAWWNKTLPGKHVAFIVMINSLLPWSSHHHHHREGEGKSFVPKMCSEASCIRA